MMFLVFCRKVIESRFRVYPFIQYPICFVVSGVSVCVCVCVSFCVFLHLSVHCVSTVHPCVHFTSVWPLSKASTLSSSSFICILCCILMNICVLVSTGVLLLNNITLKHSSYQQSHSFVQPHYSNLMYVWQEHCLCCTYLFSTLWDKVSWRPKFDRTWCPDDTKPVGHQTFRKQSP